MARTSNKPLSRRSALCLAAALGSAAIVYPTYGLAKDNANLVTVWKTPTCGCCKDWVVHLRKEGFEVSTNDVSDTAPIRQKLGLAAKFGSCHTAQVGGYVLEGHVPAQEVKRLLTEKPMAVGPAVPSMPVGAPGMEMQGEMLGLRDAFNVLLVTADGNSRVYQSYAAKAATKASSKS